MTANGISLMNQVMHILDGYMGVQKTAKISGTLRIMVKCSQATGYAYGPYLLEVYQGIIRAAAFIQKNSCTVRWSFCKGEFQMRVGKKEKIDTKYGTTYNVSRRGSSHYTFRKPGCQPITIPKHEPIKKVYVEMVKQIVESEDVNENVE